MNGTIALELFAKLDNVQINTKDILPASDREQCEKFFTAYKAEAAKAQELQEGISKLAAHYGKETSFEKDKYYYYKSKVFESMEKLLQTLESCNHVFVNQILYYFRGKYNLEISNMPDHEDEDRYSRHRKDKKPAEPFTSYDFIINHITAQVGTDFTQTAWRQALAKFTSNFYHERDKPTAKSKKLDLPDYCWVESSYSDKVRLGYNDTAVKQLLAVICYFNFGHCDWTNVYSRQYSDWGNDITFNHMYYMAETKCTGLQLYKNGKITLEFDSPENLKAFWQLVGIDSIINKLEK